MTWKTAVILLTAAALGLATLTSSGGYVLLVLDEAEAVRSAEASQRETRIREREAVKRRVETKERIVTDLLAGQLSLREAGAMFRDLNREVPERHWDVLRQRRPACDDDELNRWQVIGFVESRLALDPQRDCVMLGLVRELDQLRDQGDSAGVNSSVEGGVPGPVR